MESWLFFLTVMAEALLILTVLDFDLGARLPPALVRLLKKCNFKLNSLTQPLNPLNQSTTRNTSGRHLNHSSNDRKRLGNPPRQTTAEINYGLNTDMKPSTQAPGGRSPLPKPDRRNFPRAPVSKGPTNTCPTHKGSVVNCATFFEHDNYEYKLLCRGELYFRPKGAHTFRTGPVVPQEPGRLFIVKLDGTGSNVVAFCFELNSRTLGEVNGHAEFLPVQTSVASSQEAHGLVYTQGQGCVFDWVYGSRSSSQYQWDYNLRYDVGWMHSSPATEELFVSNDGFPGGNSPSSENLQTPLMHSLEGLDLVGHLHSPDALEDMHFNFAHIGLDATNAQAGSSTEIPPSSSLALPVPLSPAYQSGPLASTPVKSKSVLRRTCNICNRVLRRPSALMIHMNAHYGVKPFQCSECDYSSTNTTNLQRHQQTRHPGSSSGGK